MTSCDIVILFIVILCNILACYSSNLNAKYIIYSVNENEGFNLRRDVYIRIANLLRYLKFDHS